MRCTRGDKVSASETREGTRGHGDTGTRGDQFRG